MTTQQEAAGYYFGRFADKLVRLAATMIPRRHIDLSDDVVQATFEQFLRAKVRAIATGNQRSPDMDRQCRSYLARVVVFKCVRLKQRLKAERNPTSADDLDSLTATQYSEHEDLEQAEVNKQVWQAMDSLNVREREILRSQVLNGETYQSLAVRFHLPRGSVGSILNSAKRKLRTRLGSDFEYGCRVNRHGQVGDERGSLTRPPEINPDDPFK